MNVELGAKRLGLLHELIPKAQRVAAFINPNSAIAKPLIREAHAGASNIGWQVEVVHASTIGDIDVAFASLEQKRAEDPHETGSVAAKPNGVQTIEQRQA